MSWTEEDKAYLNSFKRTPDNDDVRFFTHCAVLSIMVLWRLPLRHVIPSHK